MQSKEGFLAFIRNTVQVTAEQLPDDAQSIGDALAVANEMVHPVLQGMAVGSNATNNLAMHWLITIATDQDGETFFRDMRAQYGVLDMTPPGYVTSTSTDGTSVSFMSPDFAAGLNLRELGLLKTPWGRTYFQFAQTVPNFGVS